MTLLLFVVLGVVGVVYVVSGIHIILWGVYQVLRTWIFDR